MHEMRREQDREASGAESRRVNRWMESVALWGVAALVMAGFALGGIKACGSDTGAIVGFPCNPDGTCEEGLVCIDDVCVEPPSEDPCEDVPNVGCPCEDADECVSDDPCLEADCIDGYCDVIELDDGAECGEGAFCMDGECTEGCFIDDFLYEAGEGHPESGCLVCDPSADPESWTDTCPSGETCVDGECLAGCVIDGESYIEGEVNPESACQICDPDVSATEWTDDCPEGTVCFEGACEEGCIIDGDLVAAGSLHPTNDCLTCDPYEDFSNWTPVESGLSCDDEDPCTRETTCDGYGSCGGGSPAAAGTSCGDPGYYCAGDAECVYGCFIDGQVHADGAEAPDNECRYCDAGSPETWTNRAEGSSCGDGGECDAGGQCSDGCTIGGEFYPHGTTNPDNVCERCDTSMSRDDWSPRDEGMSCGSTEYGEWSECIYDDVCSETGERSRVVVSYECEAGVCVEHDETELGDCTRDVEGVTCGEDVCGSWGACSYEDDCVEVGERTRTCRPQQCSGGVCAENHDEAYTETDTLGCDRSTDGEQCGVGSDCTGMYCEGGECVSTHAPCGADCSGSGNICDGEGACVRGCCIGGALFADGEQSPSEICQECDPDSSTDSWTNISGEVPGCEGTEYGQWSDCEYDDVCSETGERCRTVTTHSCSGGMCMSAQTTECEDCTRDTDGVSCGLGTECMDQVCSSGECVIQNAPCGTSCIGGICDGDGDCRDGCCINGTFYEDGEQRPSNDCQHCDSDSSTSSWTNISGPAPGCEGSSTGDWGACQYDSDCDRTGQRCRTVTHQSCSGGTCNTSFDIECQQSSVCDRDTNSEPCTHDSGGSGSCWDEICYCFCSDPACEGELCSPGSEECICVQGSCEVPFGSGGGEMCLQQEPN